MSLKPQFRLCPRRPRRTRVRTLAWPHADVFVPKQLERGCCLGPLRVSLALMVHRLSLSSADVRQRCHAVAHSHPRLRLTSCGACSPSFSAQLGRASTSHLGGGSSVMCPSLSCSGSDCRPPVGQPHFLYSHSPALHPRLFRPPPDTQHAWPCGCRGGHMRGGPRAPRARGQYIRRIFLMRTLFNCVGRRMGLCTRAFMGDWPVRGGRCAVRSERL